MNSLQQWDLLTQKDLDILLWVKTQNLERKSKLTLPPDHIMLEQKFVTQKQIDALLAA